MIKNTQNRSGITLLFVISMIVLFLLMGSSFVIMTSQFRRSSDDNARVATRRDSARSLVNRAFYDLFRGPSLDDVYSPLRGHSILGDQYGYGMKAFVSGIAPVPLTGPGPNANGVFQLYRIVLDAQPDGNGGVAPGNLGDGEQFQDILSGGFDNFSNQGGTYDGQIMTFTTGQAAGISTRIVNYQVAIDPSSGNVTGRSFVIMPQSENSSQANLDLSFFTGANSNALNNSEVLINGRPFSGTGAGFFTGARSLDQAALSLEAYNMNQVGVPLQGMLGGYLGSALSALGGNPASVNEDYDAPDYQNAFLAVIGDANGNGTIDRNDRNEMIRSFDRPSLRAHTATLSNPERRNFRANGTGEVDNDGDGIPDGIWIDIGLPIQTDTRGRVYKPLVSYLVLDMDGKIDVNAHGQIADLSPSGFVSNRTPMLNGERPSNFGRGFGPSEITMNTVFPPLPTSTIPEASALIQGNASFPGRYGMDGRPGVPASRGDDLFTLNKWFSHPTTSIIGNQTGLNGGLFGSPMDAMGRFATGSPNFSISLPSDPFNQGAAPTSFPIGMPIVDWTPDPADWPSIGGDELSNHPYEMSFREQAFSNFTGSIDQPFNAREMERVLRRFDSDAVMLPPRLRELTRPTVDSDPTTRFVFTHASREVPVPPTNLVTELRNRLSLANTNELFLNVNVFRMLSPDLVDGLRMDPNRPFGNGLDGDRDSIVDEVWQGARFGAGGNPGLNETEAISRPTASGAAAFTFDRDGFNLDQQDLLVTPQQTFARHLYVLTLLLTEIDQDGDGDFEANDWHEYDGLPGVNINDVFAYRTDIAQWAINVANFRDPDSIMHPFEYDLEPFDGWDVNHILGDNTLAGGGVENAMFTRVAWGVERPEMLISEVMGNHDRATEDLNTDIGSGEHTSNHPTDPGMDPSLDSRFVPRSSVFIEFYNPWISTGDAVNTINQTYPAELYAVENQGNITRLRDSNNDGTPDGIDLTRMDLAGTSPVWQVVITESSNDAYLDHDNGNDPRYDSINEIDILRRVYFVRPTAPAAPFTGNKVYYPDENIPIGQLAPGAHAVLGSAGIEDGDQFHTYLGRRTDGLLDQTRRITLDTANSTVEQVYWDTGTNRIETKTAPAIVVPVGMSVAGPRSLGATDPLNGYTGATMTDADGFEMLTNVVDTPLDQTDNAAIWRLLLRDGLNEDLQRTVHLRRLANPVAAFDRETNPYLTIDSISMPINVFNGEASINEMGISVLGAGGMRATPLSVDVVGSRERGANSSTNGERMLWQSDQAELNTAALSFYRATDFGDTDGHHHSYNFSNSLGELDFAYRQNPSDVGFSALTWNNRPYISHLELANVPFTSSYRLLHQYAFATTRKQPDNFNAFRAEGDGQFLFMGENRPGGAGTFNYLLNFHADRGVTGTDNRAMHLYRLMDYLEVPSRFVGTETFLNPNFFGAAPNSGAHVEGLNAPFNRVSNYRYPGKINLNTIFDQRVWNGLMRANGIPGNYVDQVPFSRFALARGIGNAATVGPSAILAPFRSGRSANYVPEASLIVRGANTGLFRRPLSGERLNPLFDNQNLSAELATPGDPPLFNMPANIPNVTSNDPDRSPIFRNDLRQRLGNLVTTRSSVFSIWITVGFFEIDMDLSRDPHSGVPSDIVFREEVGADTGEAQRYRGFFMVDRSIPVGFEPGSNHNVDRAILTSSIIQRGETN